ncbi:MAG TPA: hypothetical protein VMY42_00410, partial [Thermoguttaceae bacterium]|nr:hypothetical protein [Thermoguttaceae bacterium]
MRLQAITWVLCGAICATGCQPSKTGPSSEVKTEAKTVPVQSPAAVPEEKSKQPDPQPDPQPPSVAIPEPDAQTVAAAAERVAELGGKVEYDSAGNIVAIDL